MKITEEEGEEAIENRVKRVCKVMITMIMKIGIDLRNVEVIVIQNSIIKTKIEAITIITITKADEIVIMIMMINSNQINNNL